MNARTSEKRRGKIDKAKIRNTAGMRNALLAPRSLADVSSAIARARVMERASGALVFCIDLFLSCDAVEVLVACIAKW